MKYFHTYCLIACIIWGACQSDKPGNGQGNAADPAVTGLINNPNTADFPLDTNQLARISYEQPEYDFGEVNEGEEVVHRFRFTNTGQVPLTILKARSSCGCTIPEYPEDPIEPGGSGEILAKFNTTGKHDLQKKLIYITANTYPYETSVLLKGIVHPVKN